MRSYQKIKGFTEGKNANSLPAKIQGKIGLKYIGRSLPQKLRNDLNQKRSTKNSRVNRNQFQPGSEPINTNSSGSRNKGSSHKTSCQYEQS